MPAYSYRRQGSMSNFTLVRLRSLHLRVLAHRLNRKLYRVKHRSTKIRVLLRDMRARVRTELEFYKNEKDGSQKIYTVLLDMPLDRTNRFDSLLKSPGALVYCSCEDFKFRLAYALKVKGLLIAKRAALGRAFYQYPKITNPGLKVRACKHITMAVEYLRGKTVTELADPASRNKFLNPPQSIPDPSEG